MKPQLLAFALPLACAPPPSTEPGAEDASRGPAEVVRELCERVTFDPGTTIDWDAVRALFVEDAVVVLRTGREEMTVLTLEGFVDDFVRFIEPYDVERTGFRGRVLELDGFA